MIDWLTFKVDFNSDRVFNQVLKIDGRTGAISRNNTHGLLVEGTYSSTVQVYASGTYLYVSGNLVKFLTGQNVVGSDDPFELVLSALEKMLPLVGLRLTEALAERVLSGCVEIHRADCTFHHQLSSDDAAAQWLRAMADCCTIKYRGRGLYDDGFCSLLFGVKAKEGKALKGSRLSSFKFYNKFRELKVHPINDNVPYRDALEKMTIGQVRGECTIRSMELKTAGLSRLSAWSSETSRQIYDKWIAKMTIVPNIDILPNMVDELPVGLRSIYMHWRNGVDCRQVCSRSAFYRYRQALLEHGVDLMAVRPSAARPKVVPVLDVVVATTVDESKREALFWELVDIAA